MEEPEIVYTFNPEHFKELCYTANSNSPYTFARTKKALIFLLISILIVILIYVVSLHYAPLSFVLVIAAMFVIGCVIYLITELSDHYKFKKRLGRYLAFMEGRKQIIKVSDDFIKMETDEETVIESLKELKVVLIRDECIRLKGQDGNSYYFIAKSMDAESYKRLKAMIESKLI